MSDPKTPTEILEALGKPFPKAAIKQRQGGGGKRYDYVETHTVINRLNSATNGEWSFHVRNVEWRADLLIVQGELSIPGLGTRSGFGVQKVAANAGEDLVKGASSDALKKCATLFGVALDLYGVDYEDMPQAAPQRAQKPASATRPAATIPDAPPTSIDRERVIKALHAIAAEQGFTHEHLHQLVAAKGFPSMTDAPTDVLVDLGKKVKHEPEPLRTWLNQRAADQVALMPGIDEVPNPERFTR